MTITLTVEEAHAYRAAVRRYTVARLEVIQEVFRRHITIWNSPDRPALGMEEVRAAAQKDAVDAIEKWDVAHPFPKLIPDA